VLIGVATVSTKRRIVMGTKFDTESRGFPAVIWVDANKQGDAVNLIFGGRIEGQGTPFRITITSGLWENLKFLVDGPKPAA
jgi:hypothetical protein